MEPLKIEKDTYTREEVQEIIRRDVDPLLAENRKLRSYSKQLADHMAQQPQSAGAQEPLENAISELKEIAKHVDGAINNIIASAEKMEKALAVYMFAGKDKLLQDVVRIMEACNVQDLTSQRIKKVRGMLGDKTISASYTGQKLESGPQLPGKAMSQEDIDALLKI